MKSGIHPENYRTVVFKDMSNGDTFFSRSTVNTKETIDIDGVTYPIVKMEISSSSHPFYTGKSKLVDTAGRVDKFMNRLCKTHGKVKITYKPNVFKALNQIVSGFFYFPVLLILNFQVR